MPVRIALLIAVAASAAQLPIKLYTTADGLPHNIVNGCMVQDSRGFMWFCGPHLLSRFDGYRFVNYGVEHGLPHRGVTSLIESHDGDYWIGTYAGLYRFRAGASGSNRFESIPMAADEWSREINVVFEDHA